LQKDLEVEVEIEKAMKITTQPEKLQLRHTEEWASLTMADLIPQSQKQLKVNANKHLILNKDVFKLPKCPKGLTQGKVEFKE
jgi:hypothetical protein